MSVGLKQHEMKMDLNATRFCAADSTAVQCGVGSD